MCFCAKVQQLLLVGLTNLFSSRFAQLYTQDLGLDKAACSVPRVHTVAICMEDPSRDYFSLLWIRDIKPLCCAIRVANLPNGGAITWAVVGYSSKIYH
ncbi:hypothetical protein KC19_1G260200 [Ceratodon purpureus]|uniref:Secreted protein n=1 Tax=Ceratodon purpureus TaxID=3225 RepID=A0A8T0J9F0_CERPU|nr:hypothetical protein KC19_1G260200 [Ceratodon purpureus]